MSNDSKQRHNLERRFMQVKQILTDVQLVIADLEVHLNGELRSSPTLCALIPAANGHDEKIIPLNTPDGRPIFMNPDNAIAPTQA
jgi:predicted site-specific integrase-resolvase